MFDLEFISFLFLVIKVVIIVFEVILILVFFILNKLFSELIIV